MAPIVTPTVVYLVGVYVLLRLLFMNTIATTYCAAYCAPYCAPCCSSQYSACLCRYILRSMYSLTTAAY